MRPRYVPARKDITRLLKAMRDEKLKLPVRLCAAWALLQMKNSDAREFLSTCLDSEDMETLHNAAYVLVNWRTYGVRPDAWEVGKMIELIKDGRLLIRPPQGLPSRFPDPEIWEHTFFDICEEMGTWKIKKAWPVLIKIVKKYPGWDSDAAIRALTKFGDRRAIPAILESARKDCRTSHVYAFITLKATEALPFLAARLLDEVAMREEAHVEYPGRTTIEAVAMIAGKKGIEPLKKYLSLPGRGNKLIARVALAKLQAPSQAVLAERLLELLNQEMTSLERGKLIYALGETKQNSANNALLKLALASKDNGLDCFLALQEAGWTRRQSSIPDLVNLATTTPCELTAGWCIDALGEMGGPRAVRALKRLLTAKFSSTNLRKREDRSWERPIRRALDQARQRASNRNVPAQRSP